MLSTPSDLRNPPARDTGSLLAQLLDFPDDDDANAQPLSAEQLAQQLAFFSEAEFNFESAPPAAPTASTYLQRTGLISGVDHFDTKQPAVDHQPHSRTQPQPQPSSLQPFYHGQLSLQPAGPAFALQTHQQLFGTSIQPPTTQPNQVVWGPNGTAFILQASTVPGQPAVMVPLQLASTIANAQSFAVASTIPPSGSAGASSTLSVPPTTIPAPLAPVTPPSALTNATGATPAIRPPSHVDTGSTISSPSSQSAESTSTTAPSRSKRSLTLHLPGRATQSKQTPAVPSPAPAPATHLDLMDDDGDDNDNDNDSEFPLSKRPRTSMDEEKRRRNTEASARFRLRKKAKEQALERAASELAARLDQLERRTKELETENAWLRGILVDRDGHDRAATAARYAALAAAAGIQPPHSAIVSTIPAIPPGFSAGTFGLGTFAAASSHTGGLPVSGAGPNTTTQT